LATGGWAGAAGLDLAGGVPEDLAAAPLALPSEGLRDAERFEPGELGLGRDAILEI